MMTEFSLQCTPNQKTGHRMKKCLKNLLLCLFVIVLAACATTKDSPTDAYPNESPQKIYLAGKEALQDKNYTEAIKRFEALDIQYPYSPNISNAQLYLIYAYYMKEEYPLATAAADRFIRLYPAHPHVDYAYYMRGLSDFYRNLGLLERVFAVDLATRDLSQMQKSFDDFSMLVNQFPNSVYAPSAHQYMIYLRNLMANHELQVGQYYYSRGAYVAAANRAKNVVAHYQGAPAVQPALRLMYASYQKLGMNKLAADTALVMQYNGIR